MSDDVNCGKRKGVLLFFFLEVGITVVHLMLEARFTLRLVALGRPVCARSLFFSRFWHGANGTLSLPLSYKYCRAFSASLHFSFYD